MNRTEKQELIDELHGEFKASAHAVLVDFKGLSVPAVTEFRRKVKQAGSRYRVVKNSLALRAVKDTYHSDGLLFLHHGVGSERWSADGFARRT